LEKKRGEKGTGGIGNHHVARGESSLWGGAIIKIYRVGAKAEGNIEKRDKEPQKKREKK